MIAGLVDHLWQSTIFAGVAWLVTLALRRNRAQVRYWVWLAASVKFLVPFSLLVGVAELAPKHTARPMVQTEWVVAVEEVARPLAVVPIASTRADRDYSMVLWLVWAFGFGTILISFGRKWTRMNANAKQAKPMKLALPIPARSSAALYEPGVFGVFRPILLLPEGIAERLNPAQFKAILAHELCHVRRRDNLTATIHMIVQAIFWFHPLVWWIGARLIEERERACDEEVLALGSSPQDYAEGILNVCKLYVESPVACVSGVTGSDLKKRIETIMKNRILLRLSVAKIVALAVAGIAVIAAPLAVGVMKAQTEQFEVASIRTVAPEQAVLPTGIHGGPGTSDPVRITYGSVTVKRLLTTAYNVPVSRVDGPDWIGRDMFDIAAKVPEGATKEQVRTMLQSLLANRFKVSLHHETRQLPIYELMAAKGGPRLKPSTAAPDAPTLGVTPGPPPVVVKDGTSQMAPGARGVVISMLLGARGFHLSAGGQTMAQLADRLSAGMLDGPVVDKTGIQGAFDFTLEYSQEQPSAAPPADSPAPAYPSLPAAMQQQLGLRLEKTKGPLDVIVVDGAERTPTVD